MTLSPKPSMSKSKSILSTFFALINQLKIGSFSNIGD